MSDEARFWFALQDDALVRRPTIPSSTMRELSWLKSIHLRGRAASWFYDDYFLCANDLAAKHVWQYDKQHRGMIEVTQQIPAIARSFCGSIRNDAPLEAKFHFENSELYWDLGPYEEGRYTALVANGWEAFAIPRRDALHLPGMNGITLRIRYDSPEGWTTYSPDLSLDFVRQPDKTWKR
jgi:hypothetical protein